MTIIAFLLVFSLLVFVHELGHFTVAKLTGIRVEEFGLGYPPRLLTIARRGDTEYTINAIPFGGFVRMLGEEDPSHPDS
ncbi:MAG: RIP metalloprotease, partial [Anaerolineales bacterium]